MKTAKKVLLFLIFFTFIILLIPFNIMTGLAEQKLLSDGSDSSAVPSSQPSPQPITQSGVQTGVQSSPQPSAQATSLPNSKFPEAGVPVLMYHSISTDPGNSLCVPEKQFSEQMEWLHSQGFHSITVDQLYQALANGGALPEKPILITFDDGYKDNYVAAWPIMKQNGLFGTFFIVSNAIVPSRIDLNQLKDLVKNGNSIGSHTVHHLDLSTLKDSQQESEVADSKKVLEDGLGISVISFCYPSGKFNQTTLNMLAKSGYKLAFTTASGRVHLGDNPLKLSRLRISSGTSLSGFKSLLS